jgi:hypothetical protein
VAHAPEDLIDPAYWAAISAKLTPGDRIFALAEDFSWAVDLLVTAATPTYAVVTPLGAVTRLNKPAKLANPERDNYEITMLAGSGFRVIRKADGLVITEAVSDRKAAERALDAYLDTIQRT